MSKEIVNKTTESVASASSNGHEREEMCSQTRSAQVLVAQAHLCGSSMQRCTQIMCGKL